MPIHKNRSILEDIKNAYYNDAYDTFIFYDCRYDRSSFLFDAALSNCDLIFRNSRSPKLILCERPKITIFERLNEVIKDGNLDYAVAFFKNNVPIVPPTKFMSKSKRELPCRKIE